MRKRIPPEELFFTTVKALIENMFTDKNPNIKSYYYAKQGAYVLQDEVKKMAQVVLNKMDELKFLITLDPSETNGPELLEAVKLLGKAIEEGDPQNISDKWLNVKPIIEKSEN